MFLTIDTELMWRHHAAGLAADAIYARSIEPAGVGIGYQLGRLNAHGLKATFFVDPMPARLYGLEPFKRLVGAIVDAGQEVQLHLHPNWTGASGADRAAAASFELIDYDPAAQGAMLAEARDWLERAGAPRPIAFRAGSYSADDATLDALAALGFAYDSSHNGSEHPWPSAIGLPRDRIAPVAHRGLIELPVTLIEDRAGNLRHFQICALSAAEMRAALAHAEANDHAAVVIVSHGFELANRAGTRANRVHRSRFDSLCALLAERRAALPTQHFADRPVLTLGQHDRPLGPSTLRTRLRQAEQLWSNWVEERAA
ncbi:polysaccharide deacetylase [Sphingomonas gilva]|uniref:Polysaccharide deacetylase n=1 Tax=Sphingomonas gilva TaxID=2305907 RepID=A0A396RXS2_9SPHN|nr:polysaccharide deacetylase [Sphingomonas gilva]